MVHSLEKYVDVKFNDMKNTWKATKMVYSLHCAVIEGAC